VDVDVERDLRNRIMAWVSVRAAHNGGWISRSDLLGHTLDDGTPLPLIDYSRGIRNPQSMLATLAIVSATDGPYQDRDAGDGLLHYAYRKGGSGGDNTKLREAYERGLPLILFLKPEKNIYIPVHPVYVVADDEAAASFTIALDESFLFMRDVAHPTEDQRRYAVRLTEQRLHQPYFRGQVIRAYATRCAICSLRHAELLEAAHIFPDSHPDGRAVTTNGLSLCTIHHRAYDADLLGISPDHRVVINQALLDEVDGPMLRHGLQDMHGRTIDLPQRPRDRPDRDGLAWRYERFVSAD